MGARCDHAVEIFGLGQRYRERFVAHDMDARREKGSGSRVMQIVGRGQDDEVDAVGEFRFFPSHLLERRVAALQKPGVGTRARDGGVGGHGTGDHPRPTIHFSCNPVYRTDERAAAAAHDSGAQAPAWIDRLFPGHAMVRLRFPVDPRMISSVGSTTLRAGVWGRSRISSSSSMAFRPNSLLGCATVVSGGSVWRA